jgi:hypothetical protein
VVTIGVRPPEEAMQAAIGEAALVCVLGTLAERAVRLRSEMEPRALHPKRLMCVVLGLVAP